MKKIGSLILIMGMWASVLWAQSKGWRPNVLNNGKANMIAGTRGPISVKGEGATTPSGVRYWDIRVGAGPAAQRGHAVKVLYTAWVQGGKQIAGSASNEKPTTFTLGAGQVIPGWEDGIEGMKVGGKRQLRIPPVLAYGSQGMKPVVPPNATLIFDIELIAVE
jgi:FKBP-type peptidyl-prolyl cis-trans isomerase